MSRRSVEYTSVLPMSVIAAYLEGLAQGLRDGSISIEVGDQYLELDAPSQATLDLEAMRSSNNARSTIEIKVGWRLRKQAEPAPPLMIRSGGPRQEVDDIEPSLGS